jgi:hypothetical protein
MTHDIVRLTDQLIFGEAGDFDERFVDPGDAALGVGMREKRDTGRQWRFALCDRLIVAHVLLPLINYSLWFCDLNIRIITACYCCWVQHN